MENNKKFECLKCKQTYKRKDKYDMHIQKYQAISDIVLRENDLPTMFALEIDDVEVVNTDDVHEYNVEVDDDMEEDKLKVDMEENVENIADRIVDIGADSEIVGREVTVSDGRTVTGGDESSFEALLSHGR